MYVAATSDCHKRIRHRRYDKVSLIPEDAARYTVYSMYVFVIIANSFLGECPAESPRFCTDYERLELRATNADQESRDSEHPNNASSDARWRNIGTYTRTNRISDFSQCEVLDDGHVRNVNGNFYSRLLDESYAMVTLQDQITRDTVTIPVHRLVAIAWVPRYEPGLYVDHINSNRSDSRASNLRWATAQENIAYAQGFPVNAIRKDSPTIKRTFNSMRLASR